MDPKYMVGMKRTTIYLPIPLHDDLRWLARKINGSMADLLRIAVEAHFKAELCEVRKDPFRSERLDNTISWHRRCEQRRLEKRLAALKAQKPAARGDSDRR